MKNKKEEIIQELIRDHKDFLQMLKMELDPVKLNYISEDILQDRVFDARTIKRNIEKLNNIV